MREKLAAALAMFRTRFGALIPALRRPAVALPVLTGAAWLAFVLWVEPEAPVTAFVLIFCIGLAGFLYALTRRVGFSLVIGLSLFVAIYATSVFKFRIAQMNLHVYDIFFYLAGLTELGFFIETFGSIALVFAALVVAGAVLLVWSFRLEAPHAMGRAMSFGLAAVAAGLLALGGWWLGERRPSFFDDKQYVFSAFIGSLSDLPALVREKGVLEMSAQAALTPVVSEKIACTAQQGAPDIVLFLNESGMPPGVYPNLAYPEEVAPFFTSHDGKVHRLRVETFGGGTWLSDFSALTGLSTNSFGNMRNFAMQLMTGRLRHTLPQYLRACGYDTTIIYPSMAEFAGSGRFYRAIGFDRVIDRSEHKAPDDRQRDAFYYDQVLNVLARADEQEFRRPQFIVASSMATHGPWNFRFAPDAMKPGEKTVWTGDKEFDEYLWRLVLAKRDRDAFRATLNKRYPKSPFLFVNFGDHQPALARLPVENALEIADKGMAWQLDPAARAFETYYSIEAKNFSPRLAMPDFPILEIPHLATLTVAAAGLPLDPVYERRLWLMNACKGLYATCGDRGAVLAFQRWMVDSRWIVQR